MRDRFRRLPRRGTQALVHSPESPVLSSGPFPLESILCIESPLEAPNFRDAGRLPRLTKRLFIKALAVGPLTMNELHPAGATETDPPGRLLGIDLVLVVDAVPGAEMRGVKFYNESGRELYGSAVQTKRNRSVFAFGAGPIPDSVRIIWRENPKTVWGRYGVDFEGPIIGDFNVDVAQRVPIAVLADIRMHGGSLRLKFRLKPNGVLFGWDIERRGGGLSKFDMPGGDFLDTRY